MVSTLCEDQMQQVRDATLSCLYRAEGLYNLPHKPIPLQFDLRGRAAGMYRVSGTIAVIRYNPHIFSCYYDHGLQTTVPHEVAHYIADRVWGLARIRPHGVEWRSVMQKLGVESAVASARFDLSGLPVRRQRRFTYRCDCDTHELTACRHNRVTRGGTRYHCRQCGGALVAV